MDRGTSGLISRLRVHSRAGLQSIASSCSSTHCCPGFAAGVATCSKCGRLEGYNGSGRGCRALLHLTSTGGPLLHLPPLLVTIPVSNPIVSFRPASPVAFVKWPKHQGQQTVRKVTGCILCMQLLEPNAHQVSCHIEFKVSASHTHEQLTTDAASIAIVEHAVFSSSFCQVQARRYEMNHVSLPGCDTATRESLQLLLATPPSPVPLLMSGALACPTELPLQHCVLCSGRTKQ